jgi:hypothetical protein
LKRVVLAIAIAAAPLFADEVHLRGGGRLSGQITGQTEESVTIDIGAGVMEVPMSTVVRVDRGTSPLQEYRSRAGSIGANDIAGWRELARWATQRGLSAQAREAWTRVHDAVPDDREANRALGLVFYDGRWMPEEESLAARGFIKLGSDWMTVAERDAIVRERDTRAEANRQAVAAEVQASETARREREAEEARKEEEEARRNDLPKLGDPMYWGWTYAAPAWE